MAIYPHVLEKYADELARHFIAVEGRQENVYADPIYGAATIGIGYALVSRDMKGLWSVRSNLNDQLNAIGKSVSGNDSDVLRQVVSKLNSRDIIGVKKLVDEYSFSFEPMTLPEAKNLLIYVLANEYNTLLENKIGSVTFNKYANSQELISLLSITYQNPGAIKKPLIDALNEGNRAEAWYTIRYEMNRTDADWMATRRYNEAKEFSLYNETITPDSAKEILRMYTIHRSEIISYEQRHSPAVANVNTRENRGRPTHLQIYLLGTV